MVKKAVRTKHARTAAVKKEVASEKTINRASKKTVKRILKKPTTKTPKKIAGKAPESVRLVPIDISEQVALQSALSEARDAAEHRASELNAVLDAMTDIVFVYNRSGTVVKANKAAIRVMGFDPANNNFAEIVRRMSVRLPGGEPVAFEDMSSLPALREGAVRGGRLIVTDSKGRDRIIQATSSPLLEKGLIKGAVSVWHDITETEHLLEEIRKSRDQLDARVVERTAEIERSHSELRRLAKYLQTAREQERTSLAREIHDELGQALTLLKFGLHRTFKKLEEQDRNLSEEMKADLDLLKEVINKVRHIFTELRPTMLDTIGFDAAVSWLVGEFQKKTGIKCKISVGDCPIEADTGLALYRIVQEALSNVARHSGASKVDIRCIIKDGYLKLTIADNGKGIRKEAHGKATSYGLLGMREIARSLNGTLGITSRKGNGTVISVELPMEEHPKAQAKHITSYRKAVCRDNCEQKRKV